MSRITDVMIRLGRTEQFVEALAADGRSYSAEIYELALRHLSRHSIGDATAFASLAERVAEASRNAALDDDDFADAPDEFLDPLVSEIRSADFFVGKRSNVVTALYGHARTS